nr:hybrid sensor histidine kinase/response regulator transcription factor [Prolixibacteraceae bacterium]
PLVPEIHFTDFKIANQSVSIQTDGSPLKKHINQTGLITLDHTQSDFTFEFVALNYTSPENNSYRYKLEGYDNDWLNAGKNRFATYTNIPAGEYIFKVTGSNNDNIWNENGRSIQLTILPPPWKTKWAYMLYLIVIGLVVMGFYFIIVNRIEQQSLLRIERHEREKTELVNQLKLRFFTNISHEFRTPLTLISSPLSKLINKPETNLAERKYLYSTMHTNVIRLLRLLKQLMDFRKLENNQMSLKVQSGNLSEFIQEISKGFHDFSMNKSIELKYEGDSRSNSIQWFDYNIVDSVIFNLLSNAIKFSNENSVINIKTKIQNGEAIIEVIDHGKGIPADKIDKVFDRFYSDNSGQDIITGTGIGLSFSKNLIGLHKGEISVSSSPGIETCFKVLIPTDKEAYESWERNDSSHEIEMPKVIVGDVLKEYSSEIDPLKSRRKEIHILVVEDNVELRKFLKNNLIGFKVIEANNGEEALVCANKFVPDLVISDVMMPKMDGVKFCTALKSNFITSHIPVILLTAKTANEHKIEGMDSGADAYIEKPFDMEVLEAQIWNLIKQRDRLRKRFSNQFEVKPVEMVSNAIDELFFQKAENIVLENIANQSFSVEDFGASLNMSRSQLFRKFKAITDCTPSDYIRAERIKEAKKLLDEGQNNVNEIGSKTGFNSASHFIATFKKYTGYTPREYSLRQ